MLFAKMKIAKNKLGTKTKYALIAIFIARARNAITEDAASRKGFSHGSD